ncbi:MAG: pyridoxal-phosphate dependent enzyme, partial [Firmicutes bacterium]|nr:pyridoxal-phosphate dependent enzyme [Bacillota bacterium]
MGFDYNEVKEAYERIKSYVRKTPLEESFYLGTEDQKVFFKLESFQRAKSFKIRGALNKMLTLSPEEIERGVATISSGNHGSSVSYAASLLGIKNAKVIVPETTPQSKVDKILYFGSEAMLMGKNYDEAHTMGMKFIKDNGMTYIDAYYDDPKIYGGQGTIAIEILEQNPQIDTIVVPIGGGGLITGIAVAAKAIKPEIRVVGVQTENCPAMIKA